ncbi:protein of unknown function [Pseudorhizobium banfieldiae]|uniref:Uncharacterized protein n=1 Tax=Pseudorhizobium banfieldiae TaxID=1125847 RepID=L0NKY7_9HYPH|nr:protein of unknown function [Pseudorhizobium banfieldiae]
MIGNWEEEEIADLI